MADEHEATPAEVAWSLTWSERDSGGLNGKLTALNVSAHTVCLSNKPGLTPLGRDGAPLDTRTIVTLEARIPGYAVIEPGATASAPVGWSGWDGAEPSGEVIIRWPGGEAVVTATGPHRPRRTEPPTNLSSSWFTAD